MGNVFPIFQTNLLPHDRRRGCNPRQILKSPCRKRLHQFILCVCVAHEVDKRRGDDVWKMADGSCDKVVFMVIKHDWERL